MHHALRPTSRGRSTRGSWLPALLAAAAVTAAGCGSSTPTTTAPTPVAVTETYDGPLTVNGAVTQPFAVQTAGTVTAAVAALDPSDAVIGISIGTWNGVTCTIGAVTLANDNAKVGAVVTGSATATGNYCVRIYDAGKLTGPVVYQISVTHY